MRVLALGGVAGPILFALVVVVCAALRPDYSHSMQVMSALGETGGPNALLMNALGFVPSGLLLVGFALSLSRLVPRTAVAVVGSVLLVLFGSGLVGAGVFSCDLGCKGMGTTREAALHIVVSVVTFVSAVAACGVWGWVFRSLPDWRALSAYSLTTCLGSAALLLGFNAVAGSDAYPGVWQRLFLGSLFLWCGVVGVYAFRVSAPEPSAMQGEL